MSRMSDSLTTVEDKLGYAKASNRTLAELHELMSEAWEVRENARATLQNAEMVFNGVIATLARRMGSLVAAVVDLGNLPKVRE